MKKVSKETFQRCPHDRQNPYTMISRDLIRDQSISPNCRWLLIYLLSNSDGWEIRFDQLLDHVNGFIGKQKLYKVIKEAVAAGYMKRDYNYEGNLRRGVIYYVSETPRFLNNNNTDSNNFSDIPDSGIPSFGIPKTGKHKKEQSSLREEKKEHIKEKSASPPPAADAAPLCEHFLTKIKERNPNFKYPNMQKWILEMDRLLRIDKRDPNECKRVIDWVNQDSFWKANCLSPAKLREKYDTLVMQMDSKSEKELIRKNRAYALRLKEKNPIPLKGLSFDEKFAINRNSAKEIPFNLPEEQFKEALITMFGGTYVRPQHSVES